MRVKPKQETTTENTGPEQQPHHPATAKKQTKTQMGNPRRTDQFWGQTQEFYYLKRLS